MLSLKLCAITDLCQSESIANTSLMGHYLDQIEVALCKQCEEQCRKREGCAYAGCQEMGEQKLCTLQSTSQYMPVQDPNGQVIKLVCPQSKEIGRICITEQI